LTLDGVSAVTHDNFVSTVRGPDLWLSGAPGGSTDE